MYIGYESSTNQLIIELFDRINFEANPMKNKQKKIEFIPIKHALKNTSNGSNSICEIFLKLSACPMVR